MAGNQKTLGSITTEMGAYPVSMVDILNAIKAVYCGTDHTVEHGRFASTSSGNIVLRDNMVATSDPVVADDVNDGYWYLSYWKTSTKLFICLDPTAGAAVWMQVSGSDSSKLSTSDIIDKANEAAWNGATETDTTKPVSARASQVLYDLIEAIQNASGIAYTNTDDENLTSCDTVETAIKKIDELIGKIFSEGTSSYLPGDKGNIVSAINYLYSLIQSLGSSISAISTTTGTSSGTGSDVVVIFADELTSVAGAAGTAWTEYTTEDESGIVKIRKTIYKKSQYNRIYLTGYGKIAGAAGNHVVGISVDDGNITWKTISASDYSLFGIDFDLTEISDGHHTVEISMAGVTSSAVLMKQVNIIMDTATARTSSFESTSF